MSRWDRLERYARWRRCGARLEALPEDVLALVASFLRESEAAALIRALVSDDLSVEHPHLVRRIPHALRLPWTMYDTALRFETFLLRTYTEGALYATAKESTCVCIFSDWTVFSLGTRDRRGPNELPIPVAEFFWPFHGVSSSIVHRAAVLQCVRGAVRKHSCQVSLTAYKMLHGPTTDVCFVSFCPLLQTSYSLFPSWLLPSMEGG